MSVSLCQQKADGIRVFVTLKRLTGSLCPCVLWEMGSAPPFVCLSERTAGNGPSSVSPTTRMIIRLQEWAGGRRVLGLKLQQFLKGTLICFGGRS